MSDMNCPACQRSSGKVCVEEKAVYKGRPGIRKGPTRYKRRLKIVHRIDTDPPHAPGINADVA